eukprot:SAG22_NODE_14929_length_361_cov_0.992366_1_plen_120_part_11
MADGSVRQSALAGKNTGKKYSGGNSSFGRMFPKTANAANSLARTMNDHQAWLSVTTAVWSLWQAEPEGGSDVAPPLLSFRHINTFGDPLAGASDPEALRGRAVNPGWMSALWLYDKQGRR